MRVLALATAAAACGRIGFDGEVVTSGAVARRAITITSLVSSTLSEFPISISIAPASGVPDEPIVFTNDRVTQALPAELVASDSQTGALEAWVRVPELPPGTTTLYLYYGGLATPHGPWDAYAGVWHMDVGSTGVSDVARGHDAIAFSGSELPAAATGILGGAALYDGIDDSLDAGDPADGSLDFPDASFSYELWVNIQASAGPYDLPIHKGGSAADVAGYDMELGLNEWHIGLSDNVTEVSTFFGVESQFLGGWHCLAGVADRGAKLSFAYVDGVLAAQMDISPLGSMQATQPLQLGRDTDRFRGLLDEVRIYPAALTADWLFMDFANLARRSEVVTIGPLEAL